MKKKIFLGKAPEPEAEKSRQGGFHFIPRSRASATPANLTLPRKAFASPSHHPRTPTQKYSSSDSGGGPARVVAALIAAMVLIVMVVVFCAAAKPRGLSPVPAPRLATKSEQSSGPPERMWIKEQMQKQGPSEELKARRARIGQFQYTGDATGRQQN
jgi:hypothetical protein